MRRYASARVATLESSHFKSSLLFLFTNTSSGFVVVSVSRARGTHCTGGAHGAGARFPRERVRHSVRGALPFANSLIIGPIVPISICPGRSLLPSMRHWDTDPACPPSSPSSFSPSFIQSTKNFLAPLRSAVESIVPADSAHYWILLVTLLVCPALILYGHHVETRYVSFIIFLYGQLY